MCIKHYPIREEKELYNIRTIQRNYRKEWEIPFQILSQNEVGVLGI